MMTGTTFLGEERGIVPHDAATAFHVCRTTRRGFGLNVIFRDSNEKQRDQTFLSGCTEYSVNLTLTSNETFSSSSNDFLVVPTFTMLYLLRAKPIELNRY